MEDYYLWLRIIKNGYKIENLSKILVHARIGNGFYIRRSNKKILSSYKYLNKFMKKNNFINTFIFLKNIIYIYVFIYSPNYFKKIIYKYLLRKKPN